MLPENINSIRSYSFAQKTMLSLLGLVLMFLFSCQPQSRPMPDGFDVIDGYDLSLVAQEPLIKDPVDIEFDELGRAFVLEMPGYPYEDQKSRIMVLDDKDHDGIYDDSQEYAAQLELASSIMPYKQGLLVAAPPYLLFVKDSDGDMVADIRDTLMGGFSTGNLQHNYNGLTYGIDNWIYAANGGNSGKPYWWNDPSSELDLKGDDFRFQIETKKLEKIGPSSGGFELGVNEWGEVMGTHNLEHVNQIIYPRKYGKLNGQASNITLVNISNHEEGGLSRIYPIGAQESRVNHPEQSGYFSGACGITYYDGGALGASFENSIWIADVVLNLIHVDKIKRNGSILEAERKYEKRDFIASTDRSFRPVNLTVGPDGSMYIVDMYREVIEHPEWIPDEIEKTLNLNAGKDKGRIYKVSAVNSTQIENDFLDNFETAEGLGSLLSNPNQWARNTAHRLILEGRGDWQEVRKKLIASLGTNNSISEFHALHILNAKGELTPSFLLDEIKNSDPQFVKGVVLLSEQFLDTDKELFDRVVSLLNSSDPGVRMQSALSLSLVNVESRQLNKNIILSAIVTSLDQQNDQWNLQALSLLSKGFEGELFKTLASQKKGEADIAFLSLLAQSSTTDAKQVAEVLDQTSLSNLSSIERSKIVNTVAANLGDINQDQRLIRAIRSLTAGEDINMIAAIQQLRSSSGIPPSASFNSTIKKAGAQVLNAQLDVADREMWLSLLSTLTYREKAESLKALLGHDQPAALQTKALEQLWESKDASVGTMLVDHWSQMSPQSRRTASDILLYKEAHHDALLTGLENKTINIGEMNFDLERRRTLLWWTDNEETKRRAEALFGDEGVITRSDAITAMSASLDLTGNVQNGAVVFDQLCSQCHVYSDKGYDVGPVLTEIRRKSKESLLHDILDPNAAVDTKYINHKVTLNDGQVHLGIIYSEDDSSLSLKKMAGATVEIPKSDISEFRSLGTSFMMEGLEGNMDHQSMADLLSFLQNE